MRKTKSTILDAVHDTANGLHAAGVMDQITLREFDRLCIARQSGRFCPSAELQPVDGAKVENRTEHSPGAAGVRARPHEWM